MQDIGAVVREVLVESLLDVELVVVGVEQHDVLLQFGRLEGALLEHDVQLALVLDVVRSQEARRRLRILRLLAFLLALLLFLFLLLDDRRLHDGFLFLILHFSIGRGDFSINFINLPCEKLFYVYISSKASTIINARKF